MTHRQALLTALAAALPCATTLWALSGGPGPGLAGAPGDSTCAQCHGGGQVNVGGGNIRLNLTNYIANATQRVIVTISDPTASRWGFQATSRLADNSAAGTISPVDGNTQLRPSGALQYITHTRAGTRPGTSGAQTFEFEWTAPASGEVTFYVAANAANNSGDPDPGDHVYTASFKLTPADAGNTPAFAASDPVKNGASFLPGIAPGAWISLFGSNFASTSRIWRDDEIVDGKLPTSLDGVSVSINGKPATVYYISPTQINAQVPDDDATGNVEVKVTTPAGTSTTNATMAREAPGFFMYDPDSRKYIAAQHADFSIVGREGLFPNATSTPAKHNEVIILYATGFGATNPATPSGRIVQQPAEIDKSTLHVTIGGQPAEVHFAGVTIAGVWQLNVKVPDSIPDGDAPVVAEINGLRTQDGAFVSVKE